MSTSTIPQYVGGTAAITAVGTALAGGAALTGGVNNVTTAVGQTAVVLPSVHAQGSPVIVVNLSATAALLFPGSASQKINGGSAGASVSVAQAKAAVCYFDGTNWAVAVSA